MGKKPFELRILGYTELIAAGSASGETIVRQPKRLALLAYLAVGTAAGFRRRDEIIGLFWPELDQAQGRTYLRKALHAMRADLADDVIIARGDDEVRVDRTVLWCDAVALIDNEQAGRHREALDLYRGELLAGLFPEGVAQEFEEWLRVERKTLRHAAARCAWELVRSQEESGDTGAAVVTARRALEIEPDNEEGVRSLMILLDKRGDRAGALRTYAEWQTHLKTEYGVEPAPETRKLARKVQAARKGESHETPPTVVPVVRELGITSEPLRPAKTANQPEISPVARKVRSTRRRTALIAVAFVAVAAIVALALRSGGTGNRYSASSVAVLPFRTIGDPVLRSPADAIAEELTTALAMDSTLVVRPSTLPADERRYDVIGRRLGTAYVIQGAVQRSNTRIRVTLRLVRTADGTAVWAGSDDVDEVDRTNLARRVAQNAAAAISRKIAER